MMLNILVNRELAEKLIEIAKSAGQDILEVYKTDFDIEVKADRSPLTEADKRAHQTIIEGLKAIDPKLPILSEEGKEIPYAERKDWDIYWLVDPLDGTREFIKKNGEFTVNISLVKNNQPVLGVVFSPVMDLLYWGCNSLGAFKIKGSAQPQSIVSVSYNNGKAKVIASRSHPSKEMNSFLSQFDDYELIPMGSSLKICLVAEGKAHFYPRLGPTMEWDTAAADAIIRAAGGILKIVGTNDPLLYNKENLLNPEFIAGNKQI